MLVAVLVVDKPMAMAAADSPVLASWELTRRVRSRRVELNVATKAVADALGFSRNYWSTFENDRTMLADAKFDQMLELFDFDAGERDELRALRDQAKRASWWDRLKSVMEDDVVRYVELEAGATSVRCYESTMVTGLLQTEAYARELMGTSPAVRPLDVALLLEARQRRQDRYLHHGSPDLDCFMSEATLAQTIRTLPVLEHQLRFLASLMQDQRAGVSVRIHPFREPIGGASSAGTLILLGFDNPHLQSVAYTESFDRGLLDYDLDRIAELHLILDQVAEVALDQEESLEMIRFYADKAAQG